MTPDVLIAHPHVLPLVLVIGTAVAGFVAACLSDAELRADVRAAILRAGWTLQAAAAQIGISRQRLRAQLDGMDPLTCLARLAQLDGFLPAFIEVTAPKFGIVIVKNEELAGILDELRGVKTRMARMSLDSSQQERLA